MKISEAEAKALYDLAVEVSRRNLDREGATGSEWFWRDRLYWLRDQADAVLGAIDAPRQPKPPAGDLFTPYEEPK
jgi:hypothetical protein